MAIVDLVHYPDVLLLPAYGRAFDVRLILGKSILRLSCGLLGQDVFVPGEILSLFFAEGCGQLALQFAH